MTTMADLKTPKLVGLLGVILLPTFIYFANSSSANAATETYVDTVDHFIDHSPYGKSNNRYNVYIVWNDGSGTYDFWEIKPVYETVPGHVLNGSDWSTEVSGPGATILGDGIILEYSPSQSSAIYGPTTINATLSFSEIVALSFGISTPIPDHSTLNYSDLSTELVRWYNYFDSMYATSTFSFTPVATTRVSQNDTFEFLSINYAVFDHWFYSPDTINQSIYIEVPKP